MCGEESVAIFAFADRDRALEGGAVNQRRLFTADHACYIGSPGIEIVASTSCFHQVLLPALQLQNSWLATWIKLAELRQLHEAFVEPLELIECASTRE